MQQLLQSNCGASLNLPRSAWQIAISYLYHRRSIGYLGESDRQGSCCGHSTLAACRSDGQKVMRRILTGALVMPSAGFKLGRHLRVAPLRQLLFVRGVVAGVGAI